ncbi:MAG: hypothetical protein ABFR95_09035, partial [Actinomycetota bacterium]
SGSRLIDVNPNDNDLRRLALSTGGLAVEMSATEALPQMAELIDEFGTMDVSVPSSAEDMAD